MSDDETEFPDSTDSSGSTDEFIEKLEDELDDDDNGSDNSSSDEEVESQDSRCPPSPISFYMCYSIC